MDPGAPLAPQSIPARPSNGANYARVRLAVEPAEDDVGGEYDALRDLFLTGSPLAPTSPGPSRRTAPDSTAPAAQETPAAPPEAATAEVEGLVLGHLPVYAPAWVGHYARSLADELGGGIAVVGLRGGQTTLDVFGSAAAELTECGTIDDAIAAAAPVVARWLIRLDETREPQMADSPRLARITLLTGVDEAAVAACFQALKGLVRHPQDGDAVGPSVRLALMGSAPERARPVAERLSRAAEALLGRSLEVGACLSKVSSGRSVSVFRGQTGIGLEDVLDLISAAPKFSRPHAVPPRPAAAPPSLPQSAKRPAVIPEPRIDDRSVPMPAAAPSTSSPLSSRIGGLQPLAARCPHASAVELAFDSSGVLHLLALAGETDGQASAEDRAVAQLTACSAWAAAHLALLALTAPAAGLLTAGARPVLHLATRNAPAVRRLLDTDLRVHLLAPVAVDGREGVACIALN